MPKGTLRKEPASEAQTHPMIRCRSENGGRKAVGEILKPDYVTAHFPNLLKKYGLRKIRFHDLRHTCASLLLSKSVNMKVIQMWMGHSSMKTTFDIYAHLDVNAKEEAARILEKVLRLNENESED